MSIIIGWVKIGFGDGKTRFQSSLLVILAEKQGITNLFSEVSSENPNRGV